MATIFREWSYRYQWFNDAVIRLVALSVGGETSLRQLAIERVYVSPDMQILDLCCGDGQTTRFLVARSANVIGLDADLLTIKRASNHTPDARYVKGWAEAMPFDNEQFDLVHASFALHEMRPVQLWRVLQEVHRVLKPEGTFTFADFHSPINFWYGLVLDLFLWLFETETARQFIKTDLFDLLARVGFQAAERTLYAGGSLQVIQANKGNQ